jgi:hypothetical protein
MTKMKRRRRRRRKARKTGSVRKIMRLENEAQ